MIKKRLNYETVIDPNEFCNAPTNEEIEQLIEIAKQNPDCIVRIHWYVKYNGWFDRAVSADDTVETFKARMPKSYGL
jgi:hypothetical protein